MTLAPALKAALATASSDFAAELPVAADGLELFFDGSLQIFEEDVFGLFGSILADPEFFGFDNVTQSSQGMAVDPDTYLFWDDLHPTTKAHNLIGIWAQASVPEPSTALLVAVGLLILSERARLLRLRD